MTSLCCTALRSAAPERTPAIVTQLRRGVLLSMGAKILGNIEIGEYSRVGAGSVVLKSVPSGCTAVGVPAKLVNCAGSKNPSQDMNQVIEESDFDI